MYREGKTKDDGKRWTEGVMFLSSRTCSNERNKGGERVTNSPVLPSVEIIIIKQLA